MSAFKKSLLVAGVAMILSNNVFADDSEKRPEIFG
ncbi:fimbrial protein [Shigella sonnei]|nr:fimbrial protein [Shigella sonnei]